MTPITTEIESKERELFAQTQGHKQQAMDLVKAIKDDTSLSVASDFLRTLKGFAKMVQDHYGPDIEKAYALHKSLTTKRADALLPLQEAEAIIKRGISNYLIEQERKAKAEQERLLAEQKKQAEEAQLAAAEQADKSGDHERAAAILEQPAPIAAPQIQAPKMEGVSAPKKWKGEVYSKLELIKAVAAGLAPEDLLTVNQMTVDKLAGILKKQNPYPGIRAWETITVTAKAK